MDKGLHAAVAGAEGAPVVFLHGFGATGRAWDGIVPMLGQRRSIAFDLPGHGGSSTWPGAGPAKVGVKAVLASLDAMGVDRFHLCGHSFGGAVAALVALAEPQRVLSATLLAPGGFGHEINARLLRRYARARIAADLVPVLENMFGWANPVPDSLVALLEESRADDAVHQGLIRIADLLFGRDEQGVIPRDALATLPMPVKVLWGTQDRVLPTRQCHRLPARFAVHVFEDTGHMLPDEIPGDVAVLLGHNVGAGETASA